MSAQPEEIIIPAFLRAARGAYGDAVRKSLAAAGFDDIPRNGPYVLGGVANRGFAAADVIRDLRVSKQAASQLVDTLVLRGYLVRATDPDDRRRLTLEVTPRGVEAAKAVREGVEAVDEALASRISADDMHGMLVGLHALAEIRAENEEAEE
jgi:DNA-binding MarR family transcriptional regulator